MFANQIRKTFEQVGTILSDLLDQVNGFDDRLLWLEVLDLLDELKEELVRSHGRGWPEDVRHMYVIVRTGVNELYQLLFILPGDPPVRYAVNQIMAYRKRVQKTLARYVLVEANP